jgi:hypothetical protein
MAIFLYDFDYSKAICGKYYKGILSGNSLGNSGALLIFLKQRFR